ncbi:hypothetical protein [Paraburkholderia strydomiana]|uniref:hypothetical protein n=1 Tax=Paraburkholderia strydomiana TaxID=1245417 RepID=UPI001BE586F3|nr:hypothetical protein [Paraburkholderia strydomiana]MBT2794437.1 hypothetical protein [Paraburkholderia strydomiana]
MTPSRCALLHEPSYLIGVPQRDLAKRIDKLMRDCMAMGSAGGSIGAMDAMEKPAGALTVTELHKQ